MSEQQHEPDAPSGEELIDDEGRNPTQQAIDEDEGTDETGGWEETNDEPAQGEHGQEIA